MVYQSNSVEDASFRVASSLVHCTSCLARADGCAIGRYTVIIVEAALNLLVFNQQYFMVPGAAPSAKHASGPLSKPSMLLHGVQGCVGQHAPRLSDCIYSCVTAYDRLQQCRLAVLHHLV